MHLYPCTSHRFIDCYGICTWILRYFYPGLPHYLHNQSSVIKSILSQNSPIWIKISKYMSSKTYSKYFHYRFTELSFMHPYNMLLVIQIKQLHIMFHFVTDITSLSLPSIFRYFSHFILIVSISLLSCFPKKIKNSYRKKCTQTECNMSNRGRQVSEFTIFEFLQLSIYIID